MASRLFRRSAILQSLRCSQQTTDIQLGASHKNARVLDLAKWLKSPSPAKDDWSQESEKVLRALAFQIDSHSLADVHLIVKRLEKAGLFQQAGPEAMQLFLETLTLERLTKSMQDRVHAFLASFLETGQYSVLLKVGLCLQIIELAAKQPSQIKDQRLVTVSVAYLFERAEYLNVGDMIQLYTYATVVGELTDVEQEQLLGSILSGLDEQALHLVSDFNLIGLLWSVVYQRYRLIARELETGMKALVKPYSPSQRFIIDLLFPRLSKSIYLQRSFVWGRYIVLTKDEADCFRVE